MRRRDLVGGIAVSAAAAQQTPDLWSSVYRPDPLFPHHLVNRDGRHLFILNKTAWAYFACKDPRGVLERARAQGVNVIRVALEGQPYFDVLGLDLWPWGGTRQAPQWDRFPRAYWDEVERRTKLAREYGIGLDVVLYMALHPEASAVERHKAYWKQVLNRLGGHPNVVTWEIANEYLRNEVFQDAAGEYLAAMDRSGRPVCTSDGTTDDAAWPEKRWVGLAIVHTCTGSGAPWTLREWYLPVARNTRAHGKPAFNNETGREKRHANNDPVHRRKQSWIWCCAGGYWTWHSWEGCEGIDDASYRAAGGEFLKPLVEYFGSLPFWKMAPNETVCTVADGQLLASTLSMPDRSRVAAYLCTESSASRNDGHNVLLRRPPRDYRIRFLRPADLRQLGEVQHKSAGLRRVEGIALPEFEDDLLVDIVLSRRGTAAPIPGTR